MRFTPISFDAITQARAEVGKKNGAEAVRLLQPAAEEGDGEAALFLGNILPYGSGIAEDAAAARKWLQIAVGQGRVDALQPGGDLRQRHRRAARSG